MTLETSAPLLEQIEWSEPLFPPTPLPPALEKEARKALGSAPPCLEYTAESLWLSQAVIRLSQKPFAHLDPTLAQLVILVVSQDNSCRHCYGAQRALLKILGYSEKQILKLEHDLHLADLSEREKAALDFARQISRANPRPARPEREALMRLGYSQEAIAELAYCATSCCIINRIATMLAVPPMRSFEKLPESLMGRLMRPLIAGSIRRKGVFELPEPPATAGDNPFLPLITALGTSPCARVLHRIVDDAWTSPGLPRRARLLLFGVIACALNCPYSGAEICRLLESMDLTREEVEQIFANLTSPRLDPLEVKLMGLARETVRYRPEKIQKLMREVAGNLSRAQLLEVVGVCALGNALCRLSFLLP